MGNAQIGTALDFDAFYTAAGAGKTGLTVTVDVYDHTSTKIVNGAAVTEIGGGLYRSQLASGSNTGAGNYRAIFKTTDVTVDQQHIAAVWVVGRTWTERLDANISSRLATAGYTAPDNTTIANIYAAVDTEIAAIVTAANAIKAKTDNLPIDPADASDIAASFATVNTTLATISAYIDTEVAAIKARTDNLPGDPADASDIAAQFATISATLATIAGYLDTEVAAIKAKTDNLPVDPADASDIAAQFTALTAAVAAVNALATAVKAKTDNLPADPADASDVAAAITMAESSLAAAITALGSPAQDAALATAQADLTTLIGRLTAQRALNLDHLDADVSAAGGTTDLTPVLVAVDSVKDDTILIPLVKERTDRIGSTFIEITKFSDINLDGLALYKGDDYTLASGRSLVFTIKSYNLTLLASIELRIAAQVFVGTILSADSFRVEIPAVESADLTEGYQDASIVGNTNVTLAVGTVNIKVRPV